MNRTVRGCLKHDKPWDIMGHTDTGFASNHEDISKKRWLTVSDG